MTINLVTLGCAKNTVDSEKLLRQLEYNGMRVYHNSNENTDIVIINTCGFILDAKTESIQTILQYCYQKEKGHIKQLIVIGCLSERYSNSIKQEIHEVDAFFGVNDHESVLQFLGLSVCNEIRHTRVLSTPSHYAYLKLSEGCNRKCSFCAIPLIRGRQVSVSIEEIIKEAVALADAGVKELILIAQDLTAYGTDIYKKRMLLPLLSELCKIQGFEWIRLHYAYPDNFPVDDLAALIKEERKICRYLDIPFQHINNRILRDMHRGYNKSYIIRFINEIRAKIPEIVLRSTIITGFPGETEDEFRELVDFVKEMKIDRLGVFTYSHEEGTVSGEKYTDNIPQKIKLRRMEELLGLQQKISYKNNLDKIGRIYRVIIDGEEDNLYKGRTEYDSPEIDQEVLIQKSGILMQAGQFYNVRITGAMDFDLLGIAEDPRQVN